MSEHHTLTITNADSFMGFAITWRFLEENRQNSQQQQWKVRALCRTREGLEELKKHGAEVVEVDYNDENKVREVVRQSKCVILIPEASENPAQLGQNVIKASKQEKVEHLVMFSCVGVDRVEREGRNEYRHLKQYAQLEKHVQQEFSGEKHCIIRCCMFNQMFYYLSPMVEEHNELRLPVNKDKKWSTVDIRDVTEAVVQMAKQGRKKGVFSLGQERKQMYQFTGQRSMTAEEMARTMGEALEKGGRIQYNQISSNEAREYLCKVRENKNFRERPRGGEGRDADAPAHFPIGAYLHDQRINVILEMFQLINDGKMEETTKDLREILDREPQDLRKFFENNRDQFRRLR